MNILALDLSQRSTGWAVWPEGADKPRFGHWQLGSAYTSDGRTYAKLHECLMDLRALVRFELVYFEDPINPAQLSGHTNIDTLRVLAGLAAHTESYCAAVKGVRRVERINISSWRRDFIGKQKRGTKRQTLKDLTIERCRQLGFNPSRDDEADALGICDYACTLNGIVPPWRKGEVLRPMLSGAR